MKKIQILLVILFVMSFGLNAQSIDNVDFISPYNDGVSAIKKNDKWAFINESGDIIIPFREDLVLSNFGEDNYPVFNSNRCLITEKVEGISYFGYIDKSGETVIAPQFLNAINFNNGLAIVIQLHKDVLGYNNVLGKNMIQYSYTETVIDIDGELQITLSDKPTHITLAKGYLTVPPKIKSKFISDKLIATYNKKNNWVIIKIDEANQY